MLMALACYMEWYCYIAALIKRDCYNQSTSNTKYIFILPGTRIGTNILLEILYEPSSFENTVVILWFLSCEGKQGVKEKPDRTYRSNN